MKRYFVILITFIIVLSGCDDLADIIGGDSGKVGSLRLQISSADLLTKTIEADVLMEIAVFDIEGYGPDQDSFTQLGISDATIIINNLAVGMWNITAIARNENGVTIASDQNSAQVSEGITTPVDLVVRPLEGDGYLDVDLSWPSGSLNNPSVNATLLPEGQSSYPVTCPVLGNTASCSETLTAGYYTLSIQLLEGSVAVWGRVEAVRIIEGQTSSATYILSISDINTVQVGNVQLNITSNLQNPLDISLSGQQSSLALGENMTVSATVSQTPTSYQWYLNGVQLNNETSNIITIGSTLSIGSYWLDLLVGKDGILSSEGVAFMVTETVALDILMHTVDYATEVSWEIRNASDLVVASGSGYSLNNTDYPTTVSLEPGTYTLIGIDSFGDGWNGSHLTITDPSETVLVNQFTFSSGSTASTTFTVESSQNVTLDFEDSGNLGVTLGGGMSIETTGGGHLYCESYLDDDYIYFDTPTHVVSFEMNALPWDGFGAPSTPYEIEVIAENASAVVVWSQVVDLSSALDWSSWTTVSVHTGNISSLRFVAPGHDLWPSIDNMTIQQ